MGCKPCRSLPIRREMPNPGEVAVSRQPICDRSLRIVGYELLCDGALHAVVRDAARTTSAVITDALTEIGLDVLVGDRPAHLDVSRTFLLEVSPLPLRPDRLVLELPAATVVDERLLETLRRLAHQGFTIALDDAVYHPELEPLLRYAAIAKLDAAGESEAVARHFEALTGRGLAVIATGIDTPDQFDAAFAMGFERFQGFHFARPRVIAGRGLPSDRIASLRSASRLVDGGFDELERTILHDVGLSYKLLRFVNSAFFALPRRISTVHDAMTILGERMVRRWALMITLASAGSAPDELIALALTRARMCELIGETGPDGHHEQLFTVGMFSVVDALLGAPLPEVLAALPFEPEIELALTEHAGPLGDALARVIAYERGDFGHAGSGMAAAYRDAVTWADAAAEDHRSVRA